MKILLILSTLLSFSTWAHTRGNRPVEFMQSIKSGIDQNRAGYGWLNTSSEVEAETFFHQLCPQDGGSEINGCLTQSSDFSTHLELANQNVELALVQLMRQKIYEYHALEAAALGEEIPDIPLCLAPRDQAEQAKEFLSSNRNEPMDNLESRIQTLGRLLDRGISRNPALAKSQKEMLIKLRAVKGSFQPDRNAQAILLENMYAKAEPSACRRSNSMECLSLRRKRDRMRQSFPAVFSGGLFEDGTPKDIVGDGFEVFTDECGHNSRQAFELSMYEMIGADGAPENINRLSASCPILNQLRQGDRTRQCALSTERRRLICRGQRRARPHIDSPFSYDELVNNSDNDSDGLPDGLFSHALAKARGAGGDTEGARLEEALNAYNAAFERLKEGQVSSVRARMRTLCNERSYSLRSLAGRYPRVLKQTILDMQDEESKGAIRHLLCQNGLMQKFQRFSQSHSCRGVNVDRNGNVNVNREAYGYPFVGRTSYQIAPQEDGSYKVKLPLRYRFHCDRSLANSTATQAQLTRMCDSNADGDCSDHGEMDLLSLRGKNCGEQRAAYNDLTQAWVQFAGQRFSSQAQRVNDPKIDFEIVQCDRNCPAGTKTIDVYPCYNTDADRQSCATNGSNWEDEEGYSFAMSNNTIWHETGHALGLQDEYDADYYPAHALGEDGATTGGCNSTMASSHVSCHNFYPRHFREIIRPALLQCENRGKGPADE